MPYVTSLMGLTVPQQNDPSPGYVSAIAASLALLDPHNHTPGQGAPIPVAGLNINAPLPFNSNSATALRSAQFSNLGAALSAAMDNNSAFVYGGDLYFLNGTNQVVRLTNGSSPGGTIGGFLGDYVLSGAQATYTQSSATYTFLDHTGDPATASFGAVTAAGSISGASVSASGVVTGASVRASGDITGASVTAAATLTGANVVSNAGFKQYLGPFYFGTTSASGSPSLCTLTGTSNTGTVGSVYFPFVAPYPGSIVAVSGCLVSGTSLANTTNTVTVYAVINETTQSLSANIIPPQGQAYASAGKGIVPFFTNDRITVFARANAGTSFNLVAYLQIEVGA